MSNIYFADSYYFIALLVPDDIAHKVAWRFSKNIVKRIITTEFVLLEVADALCNPQNRSETIMFIEGLYASKDVKIVKADSKLFNDGMKLYKNRLDKLWSLTDCISFVVMERENIAEALTSDRHFEQAGFKALLIND